MFGADPDEVAIRAEKSLQPAEPASRVGSGQGVAKLPGAPADEHPGPHEPHHIDGNPTNNRPDNLIMLRRDCHRKVGRDPSRSSPDRASWPS